MSVNNTNGELRVFEAGETYIKEVAEFIIDIAHKAIEERGRFSIALSGGNTPNQLYTLLGTDEYKEKMPWKHSFVFWGDERCVALDDKLNNAHVAVTLLLDKVHVPWLNIFTIPVNLQPDEAAIQYEQTIRNYFNNETPAFDLILLGLGENAHTASLFPGTEVLQEQTHLVKAVYVDEQKMFRVTMTAPLINLAHNIAFLVTGQSKAEVLKTIFTEPYQPEKYPAQLIKPVNGKLYWFADKAAAALV